MKLNPWYKVLWRRFDQWARRLFFSFDTPLRRRLYDAKREIAINEVLTQAQKADLARINHLLGYGSVYRFTPEQRQRQAEMAQQVVEQMKRNGKV